MTRQERSDWTIEEANRLINGIDRLLDVGVYTITNRVSGWRYIGSSNYLRRRVNSHRSALRRGNHPIGHLQGDWNAWGEANFDFTLRPLRSCLFLDGTLHILEQTLIDIAELDSQPLYNSTFVTRSGPGIRRLLAHAAELAMEATPEARIYHRDTAIGFVGFFTTIACRIAKRESHWDRAERRRAETKAALYCNARTIFGQLLVEAGFSEREASVAARRFNRGIEEYGWKALLAAPRDA